MIISEMWPKPRGVVLTKQNVSEQMFQWFLNETPSIFNSFTPRTVFLCTCYCESFDG